MPIILRNLLHNAIKHSPANNAVRLEIRATESVQLFVVQDWGDGMSSADVARLMESQLKMSQLQSQDGIGLGLLLVQEFTALHNGKIAVESNRGEGTRIALSIPNSSLMP